MEEIEIDLRELLKVFWNKKIQITLIVAIFIVLGIIYTIGFVTPKYSASTTLLLASSNNKATAEATITASDMTVNSKLVSTYSTLIKSKNILGTVISNLSIDIDEEILRKNIAVSAVKDTEVIEISVTNEDAKVAAKIANEIAKVFIEKVKEEFYKIENVHVVDVAEVEDEPSNINHPKDILIFATVGVIISFAYVFIGYMLDTTIKTSDEIESMLALPVIASIPIYEENLQKSRKGR